MEKIDLTKCNNCRFRAKVNGKEKTGRIQVIDGCIKFWFDYHNELNDIIHHTVHMEYYRLHGIGDFFDDFEIVPRDPEAYRDWQVGDIIWDSHESGDSGRIIFRSGDFVAADIDGCRCYTCEELFDDGYRLVLTDIEQQIIEERKKYEPQDGDIVAWKDKEDDGRPAISIYREKKWSYMTLFTDGTCRVNDATLSMGIVRPATDEEKQLLFDAMSKEGKRWNAEKKVVEDIPKPYEFRKGEPVLVKDEGGRWIIGVFIQRENSFYEYRTRPADGVGEISYRFCLPYNEKTMHLLGTSEDYKEEQR